MCCRWEGVTCTYESASEIRSTYIVFICRISITESLRSKRYDCSCSHFKCSSWLFVYLTNVSAFDCHLFLNLGVLSVLKIYSGDSVSHKFSYYAQNYSSVQFTHVFTSVLYINRNIYRDLSKVQVCCCCCFQGHERILCISNVNDSSD